jgi:hypothetical protein
VNNKFLRNYRIIINNPIQNEYIEITLPLTAHIHIKRDPSAIASTADIIITGLSRATRDFVFKDRFNTQLFKPISVEVGYSNQLIQIFKGNIMYAFSRRAYPTVETIINAWDGGYDLINSRSNFTVGKNQTTMDILNKLQKNLLYVNPGEMGDVDNAKTEKYRGCVLNGNTFNLMKQYSNDKIHIDDLQTYILQDNEVINGVIPLINSATGLLGTPERYDTFVEVKMILEPSIMMQQVVDVESEIQSAYNGQYKVITVEHEALISDAVCGDAKTILGLLDPTLVSPQGQGFNLVQNNVSSPLNTNMPTDSDVRSVYAYIVKNGRPPQTLITNQISWNMMMTNFRSNNAFHNSNELPTLIQLQNMKNTANFLQSNVDKYFNGAKINIISGWRSAIGKYHVAGEAVDFTLSGISPSTVASTLENNGVIAGIGNAPQHIHLDNRGSKYYFIDSDS